MTFRGSFWDGKNKLSLVIQKSNQDVQVTTFDPSSGEIINIIIPGSTQVEVAYDLGRWRLKSVWELGKNEGLYGQLLARTVTKSFKFPVYLWAESPAEGFSSVNPISILRAGFFPYKTNLKIGDKISIALFSLKVKNPNRIDIDLTETGYIKSQILVDGETGFVLTESFPQRFLAYFSDSYFSVTGLKILIVDASAQAGIAENVGEIVEVLGAKVSSLSRERGEDFGCEVAAKDDNLGDRLLNYFPCNKLSRPPHGNFDLEIRIGSEFVKKM